MIWLQSGMMEFDCVCEKRKLKGNSMKKWQYAVEKKLWCIRFWEKKSEGKSCEKSA